MKPKITSPLEPSADVRASGRGTVMLAGGLFDPVIRNESRMSLHNPQILR